MCNTIRQICGSRVKKHHTKMANRARVACPRFELPPA
jgi:hypothetical protein